MIYFTGSDKPSKDSKPEKSKAPKSRHGSLDDGNSDSLERKGSDGAKPGRRHRTSDPTSESSGKARRTRNPAPESPAREGSPAPAKPSRRRKNKNGSVDESEKTDRSRRSSKAGDSMTDISLPDLDGSQHGPRHIENQVEDWFGRWFSFRDTEKRRWRESRERVCLWEKVGKKDDLVSCKFYFDATVYFKVWRQFFLKKSNFQFFFWVFTWAFCLPLLQFLNLF